MSWMVKTVIGSAVIAGCLVIDTLPTVSSADAESPTSQKAVPAPEGATGQHSTPITASQAARQEKAIQDARRMELAEKEAALAAKELELKKLGAKLDTQIKALDDAKKRIDDGMKVQAAAQKKLQDEKLQKMVKLFKAMRGEQAGKLIDAMQEDMALTLLSRIDTKTVAKLVPFISQPRILRWISENFKGIM